MKLSSGDLVSINLENIEPWEANILPNYTEHERPSWVAAKDRYLEEANQVLEVKQTTCMYKHYHFVEVVGFAYWVPTEIIDVVFKN